MERLTERVYHIAAAELLNQSLGLQPIGLDVCWGSWDVNTPNGAVKNETLAILLAFRNMGPKGEVLLGNTPPITGAFALSGLWPTEAEIKSGITTICNNVRQYIQTQNAPQNGQGQPRGPVMPLRLPPPGEGRP